MNRARSDKEAPGSTDRHAADCPETPSPPPPEALPASGAVPWKPQGTPRSSSAGMLSPWRVRARQAQLSGLRHRLPVPPQPFRAGPGSASRGSLSGEQGRPEPPASDPGQREPPGRTPAATQPHPGVPSTGAQPEPAGADGKPRRRPTTAHSRLSLCSAQDTGHSGAAPPAQEIAGPALALRRLQEAERTAAAPAPEPPAAERQRRRLHGRHRPRPHRAPRGSDSRAPTPPAPLSLTHHGEPPPPPPLAPSRLPECWTLFNWETWEVSQSTTGSTTARGKMVANKT